MNSRNLRIPVPPVRAQSDETIANREANKLTEWLFFHFPIRQVNVSEIEKFFLSAIATAKGADTERLDWLEENIDCKEDWEQFFIDICANDPDGMRKAIDSARAAAKKDLE